jgi:formylglycine-generating enzyme required for sulfatase activity
VQARRILPSALAPRSSAPRVKMHCDRCNIDFPEGLRYCKWCGESLVDRPRVTSELHTCPSCSAAIQPGWAFCKSCGERLHAAPREPVGAVCPRCGSVTDPGALNCLQCGEDLTDRDAAELEQDSMDTSLITMCSSCGERLDTGSLYCKACGSAVYTEEMPFGGSALLCAACNSYSPFGSHVCRVCGAPFAKAARTVVDRPAPEPPIQRKSNTLPDLDEHIPNQEPASEFEPDVHSGANTVAFGGTERQEQTPTSRKKGPVETNLLSGTAGARSEQQAPTSIMKQGRITSPVEEEAESVEEWPVTSGELSHTPAQVRGGAADPTVEFPVRPEQAATSEPTTGGFGSEPTGSPVSSESKTEVFVSPRQQPPPAQRKPVADDEDRTREFVSPQPPERQGAREFQPSGTAISADHLRAVPVASVPQWSDAESVESNATPGLTADKAGSSLEPDIPSQALPKKRTGVGIASAAVAVIVIAGALFAVWWFVFARSRPAPRTPVPVAVEPSPVTEPPTPKASAPVVPEGMVTVAAGTYTIGRDGADPLEHPQHKTDVQAFFIDRTEVTNAAYKKFVDATRHKPPANWTAASFPDGRDDFPVTGVSWQDAADYAAWAGKRLPTEAEWEAAARGADGRIYPWGNAWRSGMANIGLKPDKPTADQYPAGMKEVGQFPQGASPTGALDLIGNAWEWVADEIKVYPGNTESKLDLESGVTYKVIRGGAYDGSKINDATQRGYQDASQAYPKVGFRCAKDSK